MFIHRVIFISFSLFILTCVGSWDGVIELSFIKPSQELAIVPDRFLTTSCLIKIEGNLDCDLLIKVPHEKSIELNEGVVDFIKSFEWYDKGKTIKVISNGCTENSSLVLRYKFSCSYF